MRILVTGGAGFVGSHYVRSLLAGAYPGYQDCDVTVVDKLTYAASEENLPLGDQRLTLVKGDIGDAGLMMDVLPGHDAVVHFAAESHVDRSLEDAAPFIHTNVLGTQNLLECALQRSVPKIVQISTDEVYGSIAEGAWTENSPLEPNSPYSASKASADLMARAYHRSHRLPVVVTRCSNNYGPYQHVEKVIPHFVTRLLNGQRVPLYGDGRNVREWLHVDDHCRGVQLALTQGREGEVYNLGGGCELSNRELTERLVQLCGADWASVDFVPDRKGHDRRYALDDSKARAELGYQARWTFDQGLTDVVGWYREHGSWGSIG
ncbi:dTDP-glucose 4,6-dehydratase [Kineosporia babensis]|uniref:dTDP-glucose 4,6-dehydratase n=1 Tax=Kineosporia babensis TaxID=499548 RepID=A0A9X1NKG2_9ACTN|nr:dTDP-glucose 4,6-dehydratase [Kineosporia babensis]MCD5315740.1 dTDP-glucose 4,6-dehydratase [Kineosporia babensis]